jgi:hypothetical protein
MDKYGSLSHTKWECKYHVVLFRSVVAGRCMSSYGSTSGRCFTNWRGRKKAGSKKGI